MTTAPKESTIVGETDLNSLRCSDYARASQLDPIGSIGCYSGYLLIEWPLPWPGEITEVADLGTLRPALRSANFRLQGLVASGDGPLRAIAYRANPDGSANFQRASTTASKDHIAEAALELLNGPFDSVEPSNGELLVCTHGKRDRCCGSMGTTLALELAVRENLGRRLWRTSHTGGHRFAPTAILLPEATGWAYVNADILDRVITRSGPIEDVISHYRGYAGLPKAELQALERSVLAEVGWSLFDARRSGHHLGDNAYQLHLESPSGDSMDFEAEVIGKELPVPVCGEPISAARKSEPVFTVSGLVRI